MILREQIGLLLGLYWKPVKAASRIIDEGRLWFGVIVAALALLSVQVGYIAPVVRDLMNNLHQAEDLGRRMISEAKAPEAKADDDGEDRDTSSYQRMDVITRRLLAIKDKPLWVFLSDPVTIGKVLLAITFGFVPGVILVITIWRSHESFGVMLRKDFVPLLNCVFLSLAAVFLPFAALAALARTAGWTPPLGSGLLPLVGLLFLVTCCVRTLWGTNFAAATGVAAVGLGLAGGALMASMVLGRFMYYLASPYMLYWGYIFLGSDVRALGDGLRSRQHLRRQLEIATSNPRDADAHYQLGLIYQQRRQYDEARKRYLRAIEIDAHEAEPFLQLGKISLEEDKLEEAIGLLTNAAKLDDKCGSHEVWRELGRAYLKSSRPEEARAALGKYIERRPYDPEGLYWQGEVALASGRGAEAKQAFSECTAAVNTMPPHRRRQVSRWGRMASSKLRTLN